MLLLLVYCSREEDEPGGGWVCSSRGLCLKTVDVRVFIEIGM